MATKRNKQEYTKPKIIVHVEGGVVLAVYASEDMEVELIDMDNVKAGEYASEEAYKKAVEGAESVVENAAKKMKSVF